MLMNTRRVKWIEEDLLGLFDTIREEIPECHALSVSIVRYKSGTIGLNIYYHEGEECFVFDKIEQLLDVYERHQILFQRFGGWGNEADK